MSLTNGDTKFEDLEQTVYIVAGTLGGVLAVVIVCLIVVFAYASNIAKQLNALRVQVETGGNSGLGDYLPRLGDTPSKPHFGQAPSVRGGGVGDDHGFARPNSQRTFNEPPREFNRPPGMQQQPPQRPGGPSGPNMNMNQNSSGWSSPMTPTGGWNQQQQRNRY